MQNAVFYLEIVAVGNHAVVKADFAAGAVDTVGAQHIGIGKILNAVFAVVPFSAAFTTRAAFTAFAARAAGTLRATRAAGALRAGRALCVFNAAYITAGTFAIGDVVAAAFIFVIVLSIITIGHCFTSPLYIFAFNLYYVKSY